MEAIARSPFTGTLGDLHRGTSPELAAAAAAWKALVDELR